MGFISEEETDYPFRVPELLSKPCFFFCIEVHVAQSLVFCLVLSLPLLVFLYFFFWSLYCLSFF